MKLGIIALPKEESFTMAREKGLDFLEFCINGKKEEEPQTYENIDAFCRDVDAMLEWRQKYSVAVGSIGRWGANRVDGKGQVIGEELEQTYRLMDAAVKLGCTSFVCGCNYVEGLSFYKNCTAAIGFFSRLTEYARGKNLKVSVYNCRKNNYVNEPVTWKIILGELTELGIKFDPSHTIYNGGDYLKEMAEWGNRFYHVHLKGSLTVDGKRFDDPPAGLDSTDWGAFMSILYAVGYNGGLSIEPHSKTWQGPLGEQGVDFTIEYFRKLIFA